LNWLGIMTQVTCKNIQYVECGQYTEEEEDDVYNQKLLIHNKCAWVGIHVHQ